MDCADSLIASNKLTLTSLGRSLKGNAHPKHKIKRVDRLLANHHLMSEQLLVYREVVRTLTDGLPNLVIAVDWSGCCGHDYHLLRASLLVDGRALVLYNMIVEQKEMDSPETNKRFIRELYQVLNTKKPVYIVSDGGFLTPWYTWVVELGWHFVGRLRGTMKCRLQGSACWQTLEALRADATSTPKALGSARLTQHSPSACNASLHLYHGKAKGRKGKSRLTKDDRMYRNQAKEPWLIATSDDTLSSRKVIELYGMRMQIEQNFRDDKSQRYGFSWRESKTQGIQRLSILCLITTLASSVLWLIGCESERKRWHLKHQANTVKKRRILSFLTLAKSVIQHESKKLTPAFLRGALRNFRGCYLKCCPI